MEQHIMNADGWSYIDSRIGIQLGDGSFIIADKCAETLQEISSALEKEDMLTRPLRRRLSFVDVINSSIIPVLLHMEENKHEVDTDQIFYLSMKILANLSQPLDCLMVPQNYQHPSLSEVVSEINQLLVKTKNAFLNPEVTKLIFGEIQKIFIHLQTSSGRLSDRAYEAIDYSIYLYRNLLYISEPESMIGPPINMRIIKIMFEHGLKEVFLKLLTIDQRDYWCVSIVQLISLLFKDKRCVNFSHCQSNNGGGTWTASVSSRNSRISDDQGSLGQPGNGGQSNGSCGSVNCRQRDETCLRSEKSRTDSTSGEKWEVDMDTDTEMARAIIRASLNDSKSPMEASHRQEENERKKDDSGERTETNSDDADSSNEQNSSLDEMINHLRFVLSDFAQEFIKQGWGELLRSIKAVLINQKKNRYQLEGHYFMWMVQYFLKLAHFLEVPFQHIKECLNIDIIGLLVSLSITSCEDIMKESKRMINISNTGPQENGAVLAHVRKNYLTVVAILQVLRSMNYFNSEKLTVVNRKYLSTLQNSVIQLSDLRQLFILLLRQYKQELHGKQYLIDVVMANHELLLIADVVMTFGEKYKHFDILEHVRNFGTQDVMLKYSSVLDGFKTNPTELNDCVFTMMHHVAGDCQRPEALMQIPIVQNFLNILDNPMLDCIPPECCDLMEYILQNCLGKLEANSLDCIRIMCGVDFEVEGMGELKENRSEDKKECSEGEEEEETPWAQEEEDEMLLLFSKLKKSVTPDCLSTEIVNELSSLNINKSVDQVELHLCQLGLLQKNSNFDSTGNSRQERNESSDSIDRATIEQCVKSLYETKNEKLLNWLKEMLVEACFVKSGSHLAHCSKKPAEPTILHFSALGKSIPLVAFTEYQAAGLKNKYFAQLLLLLGFLMPEDCEMMFPRMPNFWTARDFFNKASQLGPTMCEGSKRINLYTIDSKMDCTVDNHQTMWNDSNNEEPASAPLSHSLWPYIVQRTNMENAQQGSRKDTTS